MGGGRIGNPDSAKEQILKALDYNVLRSLNAMGTDINRLSRFWCDYVGFLQNGYTPVEAFQKLRFLPRYQEDKTGFDYFCYLGLKSFTEKIIEEGECLL